jgi:RNA recognition motif-containing protein
MHAAAVLPPPPPPPPPSEKQSQSSAAAAAPDASDAPRVPVMFTPVPLQPAQMTRIYVGNVYRELSEAEIQTVFEAFGPVRSCKFIPNPENGVGKHKGFGFIEYVDPAAAAAAALVNRQNSL